MIRELGFSEMRASWVAESWMEAFDIRSKEPAEFKFNCPNCSREFIAARYWRNQKLICPACNSHVQFDDSLVPRLHRKGWAQKRHKGGDWNLVGVSGKSRATLIRERLQTLLADSTLDEATIARELGLDEIVNAIPDQVEKSLANRGKHLTDKQRTRTTPTRPRLAMSSVRISRLGDAAQRRRAIRPQVSVSFPAMLFMPKSASRLSRARR